MLGKKPAIREGAYVFIKIPKERHSDFFIGAVTGVEGKRVGVNGIRVHLAGLANKVEQSKAGQRSMEILENPTPDNIVMGLIYRVEHDNHTGVYDMDVCIPLPPKVYSTIDGWIRESLPDMLNSVLSLPPGDERDEAKRLVRHRMDTLLDKNLKRTLYSVCRSLKILN